MSDTPTVAKDDVIRIVPDSGPVRLMRVTHVEHHIITLTDVSPAAMRTEGCICIRFKDTGGFRIADLCCPVHGADGTDPGDGPWEQEG